MEREREREPFRRCHCRIRGLAMDPHLGDCTNPSPLMGASPVRESGANSVPSRKLHIIRRQLSSLGMNLGKSKQDMVLYYNQIKLCNLLFINKNYYRCKELLK